MSVEFNLGSSAITTQAPTQTSVGKETSAADTAKDSTAASTGFSEEAAVYEKSDNTAVSDGGVYKKASVDREAIIAQMKADTEARQNQMMDMVREMMGQQGSAIGQADDVWKFLASGDFTVDEAAKAKAQEAISEDGYWGVNQTSDRIVEFAKALAGDDPAQADKLLDAFKKGFEEATKTWGKDLPDISQQTYDAVVKKFDDWKNGTETSAADTAATTAANNFSTNPTDA